MCNSQLGLICIFIFVIFFGSNADSLRKAPTLSRRPSQMPSKAPTTKHLKSPTASPTKQKPNKSSKPTKLSLHRPTISPTTLPTAVTSTKPAPNCGSGFFTWLIATYLVAENVSIANEYDVCCEAHDKCYDSCGALKETCDNNFGLCLKTQCPTCASADLFYDAVAAFGGSAWMEAQLEHNCSIPTSAPTEQPQFIPTNNPIATPTASPTIIGDGENFNCVTFLEWFPPGSGVINVNALPSANGAYFSVLYTAQPSHPYFCTPGHNPPPMIISDYSLIATPPEGGYLMARNGNIGCWVVNDYTTRDLTCTGSLLPYTGDSYYGGYCLCYHEPSYFEGQTL